MPRIRELHISDAVYEELEWALRHHPKPYMREKASGLLKIANGISATQVATAEYGMKKRWVGTIYNWMNAVEAKGLAGLEVAAGRGRPPAFSPSAPCT